MWDLRSFKVIQNLINGFSPSFVGFSSNNIFFGRNKFAMIVNMSFFCSKFGSAFEFPDSLDWFKKNETNLKKKLQTVTYFIGKKQELNFE